MQAIVRLLTVFIFLLLTGIVQGNELPAHYPVTFDHQGTIDRLSLRENEIVIDDTLLTLSLNIKVHTLNKKLSTVRALKKAMKVGFTSIQSDTGNRKIIELWALPPSYSVALN